MTSNSDSLAVYRRRMTVGLLVLGAVVASSFAVANWMRQTWAGVVADLVILCMVGLGWYLGLRKGWYAVIAVMLALGVVAPALAFGASQPLQLYFWPIVAPPMIFFLAGMRLGAVINAGLFALVFVMMWVTPPTHVLRWPQITVLGSLVLAVGFAMLYEHLRSSYERRLRELSSIDVLTGLANRRRFFEALEHELPRARRYEQPLSVALFDIDRFKAVNDSRGHAAGDRALRDVGAVVQRQIRAADLVARLGGDEFAVLLPQIGLGEPEGGAEALGERLRAAVADASMEAGVTISVGVAALDEDESAEALLSRADAALYQAKREGRDRVCVADEGIVTEEA